MAEEQGETPVESKHGGTTKTVVVRAELFFGACNSSRVEANVELLAIFFAPFASVPFDDLAADYDGRLRADVHRAGQLVGPNDLMIAATALANDLVLVTEG